MSFSSLTRRSRSSKPPSLVITPLLDMFTIILIFLIVSFSAEDYDFKLDESVALPTSSSRTTFKPSISVAISMTGVLVEGQQVVALTAGRAAAEHYEGGEIPELVAHLGEYYEDLLGGEPAPADAEPQAVDDDEPLAVDEVVVTVQADKGLDYKTLYLILESSAKAGFFKYRLAVLRK